MSDYLSNLISRSFGLSRVAQPRLASAFEPLSNYRAPSDDSIAQDIEQAARVEAAIEPSSRDLPGVRQSDVNKISVSYEGARKGVQNEVFPPKIIAEQYSIRDEPQIDQAVPIVDKPGRRSEPVEVRTRSGQSPPSRWSGQNRSNISVTDSLLTDSSVTNTQVTGNPVIGTPVANNPVTNTPLVDSSVTNTHLIDSSVTGNPVIDTPDSLLEIGKTGIEQNISDEALRDQIQDRPTAAIQSTPVGKAEGFSLSKTRLNGKEGRLGSLPTAGVAKRASEPEGHEASEVHGAHEAHEKPARSSINKDGLLEDVVSGGDPVAEKALNYSNWPDHLIHDASRKSAKPGELLAPSARSSIIPPSDRGDGMIGGTQTQETIEDSQAHAIDLPDMPGEPPESDLPGSRKEGLVTGKNAPYSDTWRPVPAMVPSKEIPDNYPQTRDAHRDDSSLASYAADNKPIGRMALRPAMASAQPEQSIKVTIGRIEVRAMQQVENPVQSSPQKAQILSLDDYLTSRQGG